MIAKFHVGEEWELIDGFTRLTHRVIEKEQPIEAIERCLDFRIQASEDQKKTLSIHELWMYDNDNFIVAQAIAYSPIYILNNEGKTVERI